MKKRVKLLLILCLALLMVATFGFAACSGTSDTTTPDADDQQGDNQDDANNADLTKSYKIGMNVWGTAPILTLYGDEAEYAIKTVGFTTSRASDDNNADKEVQNIQNFIAEGVDGLAIQGAGGTTIPQMGELAKNAQLPFVIYTFTGTPEVRADLADNNEYYAGAAGSDLEADGKILGEQAIADGNKTAVLIGGNRGDLNMENRSKGFHEGFEAGGGEIVGEEWCVDNSEALAKAQALFSSHPDVDCVYIKVGDYVEGTFGALDQLGISGVKVYLSAVNAGSADLVKEGKITAGSGGTSFACNIGPTLLVNMLDGHKIVDKDGKVPFFSIPTSIVNQDNIDAYKEVFLSEGARPVTEEMIKNLCYRFNPDVDYDYYVNSIKNDFTVDAILKANGK